MNPGRAQEIISRIRNSYFSESAVERGRLAARKLLNRIEGSIERTEIPVDLNRIAEYLKARICFLDLSSLRSGELESEGLTLHLENMARFFDRRIVNEVIDVIGSCDYVVIVRHDLDERRKRYVIAHELGHIYLNHFEVGRKFCRYAGYLISHSEDTDLAISRLIRKKRRIISWQEISANAFAGELLIPTPVLKRVIVSGGVKNLNELAELFGVSQTVMYVQLELTGFLSIIQ